MAACAMMRSTTVIFVSIEARTTCLFNGSCNMHGIIKLPSVTTIHIPKKSYSSYSLLSQQLYAIHRIYLSAEHVRSVRAALSHFTIHRNHSTECENAKWWVANKFEWKLNDIQFTCNHNSELLSSSTSHAHCSSILSTSLKALRYRFF